MNYQNFLLESQEHSIYLVIFRRQVIIRFYIGRILFLHHFFYNSGSSEYNIDIFFVCIFVANIWYTTNFYLDKYNIKTQHTLLEANRSTTDCISKSADSGLLEDDREFLWYNWESLERGKNFSHTDKCWHL